MKPNSFLRFGIAEMLMMLVLIALHMAALKALFGISASDPLRRQIAFAVLGTVLPVAAAYASARDSIQQNEQSVLQRCGMIIIFEIFFLILLSPLTLLNSRQ